jgi:hypothetical protein
MKIEVIKCDVCGAEGAQTCYFYVDRKMDHAGSMEDEHESIDLCGKCKWEPYLLAEKLLSFEQRRGILTTLYSRGKLAKKPR